MKKKERKWGIEVWSLVGIRMEVYKARVASIQVRVFVCGSARSWPLKNGNARSP